MQKFAIFVKKKLKIYTLEIKNIVKLGTTIIIYENIEALLIAYVV